MTDDESVPEKLGTEPTCPRRCPPSTSGERLREAGPGAVSCVGLFVTVTSPSQDAHARLHRLGAFLSLTGLAQGDACSSLGGGEWGGGMRAEESAWETAPGPDAGTAGHRPLPQPICSPHSCLQKTEKCCLCTPDRWVLLLSSL